MIRLIFCEAVNNIRIVALIGTGALVNKNDFAWGTFIRRRVQKSNHYMYNMKHESLKYTTWLKKPF